VNVGWVSVVLDVGVLWMCLNYMRFGWVFNRIFLRVGWVSFGCVGGGVLVGGGIMVRAAGGDAWWVCRLGDGGIYVVSGGCERVVWYR
jgi:hypothetical protein